MAENKLTRRQFVTTVTAGAGALILGNAAAASPRLLKPAVTDPFRIVTLGRTGIKTTLLGMGTGFNGGNRSSNITRAGVAESLIRTAYEKGIRYFDCADSYGTHPFTRAALKGMPRENYTLGTKMWVTEGNIPEGDKGDAGVVVDRFRKELNTDYLDLVQLHCMTDGKWTDMEKKYMDGLETLKAKNIIRAHGVSVHTFEALEAASTSPWVDVIHVRINPFGESMDKKDPALITPLIAKMHNEGKGIIGMKLIGGGRLRNDPAKINESLRFVLELGTVDLLIVGFELPAQIDDYIGKIRNIGTA